MEFRSVVRIEMSSRMDWLVLYNVHAVTMIFLFRKFIMNDSVRAICLTVMSYSDSMSIQ